MATRTAGVIGLGSMGMGAARSLLRAGFSTCAYDVRREALDAFATAGGVACASPAEVGAKAGVIAIFVVNAG
jgi:3-hydroxyisobutyrate dehydrogenase